jgi:hypothetical protein
MDVECGASKAGFQTVVSGPAAQVANRGKFANVFRVSNGSLLNHPLIESTFQLRRVFERRIRRVSHPMLMLCRVGWLVAN